MLKNYLKKINLFSLIIIFISLFATIILIQSLLFLENNSKNIINKSIDMSYKEKKKELKNYTTLAYKTVNSYYNRASKDKIKIEVKEHLEEQTNFLFSIINSEYEKNKDILSKKELQTRIINIVKATRYEKSGYFWINDFDYKMIMHPIKEETTGKIFKNNSQFPFLKLGVEKLKKSKKDIDFIEYKFYNPTTKENVFKSSIVRVFKPYNWILGTGTYIDDFTQKMKKEALQTLSQMKYGETGYFWVINSKHILLMDGSANSPFLNKDMYNIKNNKGNYIYRKIVDIANNNKEGAHLKYFWNKPDKEGEFQKLSFVYKFEPWDLIIGTGSYIVDIEQNISEVSNEAKNNSKNVFKIVILFIMMMILIILLLINKHKKNLIEKKIIKKTVELDNLNKNLENKVIIRTKKLQEQKLILQKIIDTQKSMLIITDFDSISFVNESFLNFFNVNNINGFEKKFNNLLNIFCEYKDYIYKGRLKEKQNSYKIGKEFYELVKNSDDEKSLVIILDLKLEAKSFYIQVHVIDEIKGIYLVSLIDITKITLEKIIAEKKAYTDMLTGVPNRTKFNDVFEIELTRANRYDSYFSLAILDIDNFKKFNDNYGHLIGDEVLIMIANECQNKIRQTDFFARWGGEEFIILLPETKIDEAIVCINNIRKDIEKLEHKTASSVTCSFGITQFIKGDTQDSIFKRCDTALYKAKENGRNRVESI